ncbi:MAG: reverse transcriptase family protein, partial [Aeromonas sp.]
MDFRKLNDMVDLDGFEIPRISEILTRVRDMKYFTIIDLENAYYHIPMKEDDKEKTAFYTGSRLMQFKKMPQGYKNSPAIFQRAINIILTGLVGVTCIAYIDDILIYGKDMIEHDKNVKEVLERLNAYGFKENQHKRINAKEEV